MVVIVGPGYLFAEVEGLNHGRIYPDVGAEPLCCKRCAGCQHYSIGAVLGHIPLYRVDDVPLAKEGHLLYMNYAGHDLADFGQLAHVDG